MYRFICKILATIIAFSSILGVPMYKDEIGINHTAATVSEFNGRADIKFNKQNVNTVEIELEAAAPAQVYIYNDNKQIYYRLSSDAYRFCAFETIETDCLTVEIIGEVNVKSVTVSFKQNDNSDFRVTSYFVAENIIEIDSVNPKVFDIVTDAILFGCVTFNENAEMSVNTDLLEPALLNLRKSIGEKNVNIYINVLGPKSDGDIDDWYEQMANQAEKHSNAFKTRKLEGQISDLIKNYDLDGMFFDYEYPIYNKYWADFSRFLVRLDKATDKKIGLAVAHWDLGLSYSAIKAVDMIELMQYDLFDSEGNHSSMASAVNGFAAIKNYFLPRAKVDLGVPFYGRPANGGAYWPSYRDYAEELADCDYAETEYGKAYFNSYQTIYDKTAYAMSRGFGGMMVWHYSCDVDDVENRLSLFGAMYKCVNDRGIK